jgi:hypothetical protein
MIVEHFRRLILRDVAGLKRQLQAYPEESALWDKTGGIGNPPGNLGLHVAGNLRHFIGNVLGDIAYARDRDAEFSRRDVPLPEIIAALDAAAAAVDATLQDLPDRRLAEPFPLRFGEVELNTGRFLAHLCSHLAYHLGQVDYHRRITTGGPSLPGVLGFEELVD